MSTASASSRTSRPTSRASKAKPVKNLPPEQAFAERFSSIFFSLYNPQRAPDFTAAPVSAPREPSEVEGKLPAFDSPLCVFKVKSELAASKDDEAAIMESFDERSAVLVSDLKKTEYDIEFSMVPYDVERPGSDRITEAMDKKKKAGNDKRSVAGSQVGSDASSVSQRKLNQTS
jgi:hypothetical protein